MQYRKDIKSENNLSILGLGCMRLPRNLLGFDYDKSEAVVLRALESGINYFDTAYLYNGNEALMGEIIQRNQIREKIFLATKMPFGKCKSYEDFDKFFKAQLESLKTNYIDYYLIHAIGASEQWRTLCEIGIEKWIKEKKQTGEIRQIGFSFHGNSVDFEKILEAYDWDFCMIQYNYININYQAGRDGLKKASNKGMSVFVMEPLLGGRLAGYLPKKAKEVFEKFDKTKSPAAWALDWLWDQPEVTMVLSGMNTLEQIDENVKLAGKAQVGMMSQEALQTVDKVIKIFDESYKIPCTGCNYCLPCPVNINIPACFAAYNSSYSISRFTGIQQYVLSTGGFSGEHVSGASQCIQCGKCEKECPQYIEIRKALKDVNKRMEPFWFKIAIKFLRK